MKIQVASIPEEGIELDFSQKEGWVRDMAAHALKTFHRAGDPITGHLSVFQTMENISVKAHVHLPVHAVCNRCLKAYDVEIDVHCERLFTPLFESQRRKEQEEGVEKELTQEDLNFSYYEGDEIDVGQALAEQIVLEQPMIYLCKADCKGLCPQCGINKNEQTCSCEERRLEESPFAALKNLIKK